MNRLTWPALLSAFLGIVLNFPAWSQSRLDAREMEKLIKSKKTVPVKKNTAPKTQSVPTAYNAAEHEKEVKSFLTTLIERSMHEKPEELQSYIDPQLDTTERTIISTLVDLSALKKNPADSLQISLNPPPRISAPVLYKNKHYTQVQLLLYVTIRGRQPDSTLAAMKEYVRSWSYQLNKPFFLASNAEYHFLQTGTLVEKFDAVTGEGHLILFEDVWLSRRVSTKIWLVTKPEGPMDKNYRTTILIPKSVENKAEANLKLKIPKTPKPELPIAGLQKKDSIALWKVLDTFFAAGNDSDTVAFSSCFVQSPFFDPASIMGMPDKYKSMGSFLTTPVRYQIYKDGIRLGGKRYVMMRMLTTTTLKIKDEDERGALKIIHASLQALLSLTSELIYSEFQLDPKTTLLELDEANGKLMYYAMTPIYLEAPLESDDWKIVWQIGDLPIGVVDY